MTVDIFKKNIEINTNIFSKDVVFATAYLFLEKYYIEINLSKTNKEIIVVTIEPKDKQNYNENIANIFNNELINYANYYEHSKKTSELRKIILQRALLTNYEEEETDIDKIIIGIENE